MSRYDWREIEFGRITLLLVVLALLVWLGIAIEKWRAALWAGQLAEQLQKQERR